MLTSGIYCPKCKKEVESNNEPVTVDGWYGNIRFEWMIVGGVNTVKATKVDCPHCNHISSLLDYNESTDEIILDEKKLNTDKEKKEDK